MNHKELKELKGHGTWDGDRLVAGSVWAIRHICFSSLRSLRSLRLALQRHFPLAPAAEIP
jgi:hypothetical protein